MKDSFSSELVKSCCEREFELLWILCRRLGYTTAVGALYHPPNPIYKTDKFLDFLDYSLVSIVNRADNIILAGDFNSLNSDHISQLTGLVDVIKDPTRGQRQLDHIFTTPGSFDKTKVVKSIVTSDHSAVIAYNGPKIVCATKTRKTLTFQLRNLACNS